MTPLSPPPPAPLSAPVLCVQATVDTSRMPPLEGRVSAAKLLMEVGRPDEALELLQAPRPV